MKCPGSAVEVKWKCHWSAVEVPLKCCGSSNSQHPTATVTPFPILAIRSLPKSLHHTRKWTFCDGADTQTNRQTWRLYDWIGPVTEYPDTEPEVFHILAVLEVPSTFWNTGIGNKGYHKKIYSNLLQQSTISLTLIK